MRRKVAQVAANVDVEAAPTGMAAAEQQRIEHLLRLALWLPARVQIGERRVDEPIAHVLRRVARAREVVGCRGPRRLYDHVGHRRGALKRSPHSEVIEAHPVRNEPIARRTPLTSGFEPEP